MKTLLMFLSVAILSGCGGGLVSHMNKDSVLMENCWYMLEGKAKMFMLLNK